MTSQAATILLAVAFIWVIAMLWIFADAYRRQGQQPGKPKGKPISSGEFFLTTAVSLLRYSFIRCSICLLSGMFLLQPVVSGSPAFSAIQRLFLFLMGILLSVIGMFGFGMMLILSRQPKTASLPEDGEEKSA
jgi:hypothetical protein